MIRPNTTKEDIAALLLDYKVKERVAQDIYNSIKNAYQSDSHKDVQDAYGKLRSASKLVSSTEDTLKAVDPDYGFDDVLNKVVINANS